MGDVPNTQRSERGCPDGGACHHACDAVCWRVETCEPLSGVFPRDEWPAEVVQAEATDSVTSQHEDLIARLRREDRWGLGRLAAEAADALEAKDEAIAVQGTELDRLRKALEEIASEDWRGPRPRSVAIATEALREES